MTEMAIAQGLADGRQWAWSMLTASAGWRLPVAKSFARPVSRVPLAIDHLSVVFPGGFLSGDRHSGATGTEQGAKNK